MHQLLQIPEKATQLCIFSHSYWQFVSVASDPDSLKRRLADPGILHFLLSFRGSRTNGFVFVAAMVVVLVVVVM